MLVLTVICFIALLTSVVGVVPLLIGRKYGAAFILGAIVMFIMSIAFYASPPTFAPPFFGAIGVSVLILWWMSVIVLFVLGDGGDSGIWPHAVWLPIGLGLLFWGRGCVVSGAMFRADEYANLIGTVEERVWTQDVQPKDPNHVRLVPKELALALAKKQLGSVDGGAIGSQFQISASTATLQKIHDELWWVIPLDFSGWGAWRDADVVPVYILVHGEDPRRSPIVEQHQRLAYTPGAWFGNNLGRHLWASGYFRYVLSDYSLEVDEQGKAWWVVTASHPTIGWDGDVVDGVIIVDPETGSSTFTALGKTPAWVDRVVPGSVVKEYLAYRGAYAGGWWNSWIAGAKKGLTEPEEPSINYGSDGEPYWVTSITSQSSKDESIVSIVYIDTRTGKSVEYKTSGSTEQAVLDAVNAKVAYKHQHGTAPVLYNVHGTMAAIVPILGENHTFQGVGIASVAHIQDVVIGVNAAEAYREYGRVLAAGGSQVAPDQGRLQDRLVGTVDRFQSVVVDGNTTFYLHLDGVSHLFSASIDLATSLALTRPGDTVAIAYIASGERVESLQAFENRSLPLEATANEAALRERQDVAREAERAASDAPTDRIVLPLNP